MVITDFTKLPKQIIVDLINYDNDTALAPELLTFGNPTVITGINNTSLIVTAVPDIHYEGSVTLNYNRIDIGTIPGIRNTNLAIGTATRISDLIPAINAKYQINLTADDYIDEILPVFITNDVNEIQTFELYTNPNSLIFIRDITFNLVRNRILLSSVIVNRFLNGLVYIQPA